MSFVSYAQNFEDVMLWRALRHVGPGLYVDVGAQHPVVDSVSQGFYRQGWRGIHIEPVRAFADLLRADRPDETVLQVALSDTEGTLELNVIAETGLSTAVDGYAERHYAEHGFQHERVQVPVLTLTSALKSLAGKEVHWLKIDVEGFEEHVLKGWDSASLRPWVMVVEATVPGSTEPDYANWDPILVAANYQFVYFDGLNRFYIAAEHPELAAAFAMTPNVFDDFLLSGQSSWGIYRAVREAGARAVEEAGQQLAQAQARAEAAARRDEQAVARIGALEAQVQSLQHAFEQQKALTHSWWSTADQLGGELQAIRASVGWRVLQLPRRVVGGGKRRAKAVLRRIVLGALRAGMALSPLRPVALRLLALAPSLRARLRAIAQHDGLIGAAQAPAPAAAHQGPAIALQAPPGLSPSAGRNFVQLAKAVQARKE